MLNEFSRTQLLLGPEAIEKLIAALKEANPQVEANIFKSVSNVNLSTVIAYKKDGVRHHFLDDYR
jgi:hypothetical protein